MSCFCYKRGEFKSFVFFVAEFPGYAWLGLMSIDPHNSYSHFLQFNLCNAPNSVNIVLGNVWIVVVSEIWFHRNKIISKGGVVDHSKIFSLAQ